MVALVPLDKLPATIRATAQPGTPMFHAYAQQFEVMNGLRPGSLTDAKYNFTADIDPLKELERIGADQAQHPDDGALAPNPRAVPREKLPPSAMSAAGAPTGGPSGGDRTTPGAPLYNPAKGDYPNVGLLGLNLSERQGNLAAGFGKKFVDTVKGVGQFLTSAPTQAPASSQAEAASTQAKLGLTPEDIDATKRQDQPLMATPEGMAGNVAGTVALTAAPGSALARRANALRSAQVAGAARGLSKIVPTGLAAQGAAVGGADSALQPVGSDESRFTNALEGVAGGALGGALFQGVGALARPVKDSATAAVAALANKAARYGIGLRAAQVSGSPWLKAAQAGLDNLPFNGAAKLTARQHDEYNTALSKTFGEDSSDPVGALKSAKTNLSATYDALKAKYNLQLEPWHVDAMNDINAGHIDTTPGKSQLSQLKAYQRSIVNSTDQNGEMTGDTYKQLRSTLGSDANTLPDGPYKKAVLGYRDTLDEAFKSNLSPDDAKLLDLTDRQWGNMRTLEAIAPTSTEGDFNFPDLKRVMTSRAQSNSSNRSSLVYGSASNPDPSDLAKIGEEFLNRGPTTGTSAVSPLLKFGKAVAPTAGLATVGGGLYAVNHDENKSFADTAIDAGMDLAGLVAAGKLLGAGSNSKWFAQGLPKLGRANQGLYDLGAAQLPTGGLDAMRAAMPPDQGNTTTTPTQ